MSEKYNRNNYFQDVRVIDSEDYSKHMACEFCADREEGVGTMIQVFLFMDKREVELHVCHRCFVKKLSAGY